MNLEYMQADLFSCSVCFHQFDGQTRLPKLIPTCGHTLCITCLAKVIKSSKECPLDRTKFLNLPDQSEEFPTNLLVLQAVDIRLNGTYETCNQHGKPKHLFCLIDRIQICEDCRSNHEGHRIKPVKELKVKAQAQKKKLESLLENFPNKPEEAKTRIKDLRKSTATMLERGINKAQEILKQREKDIFNTLDSLLETKEKEIKIAVEEDVDLKDEYDTKIDDLNDLSSRKRFFRTLSDLEKKVLPFKIDQVLDDLKLIEQRSIPALETFIHSLVSSTEKLEFNFLTNTWTSLKDIRGLEVDILDLGTILDMKIQGTKLEITPRSSFSEHSRPPLDLSLWKDVTCFEAKFNEGDLTVRYFQALKKIYFHCMNITSFCLRLKHQNFTDDHLTSFVSDPFWVTTKTEELGFDFQGSQVSDMSLTKLITESLVNMLQVKIFYLLANQEKITDKSIIALATHFVSKTTNLETFNLQIGRTKTTDSSIVELFKSMSCIMGKMKIFTLGLSSTKITDQSLVVLSQENLKWSVNLESLNLFLFGTQITDHGLKIFCEEAKDKLHRIKRFSLDLRGTQITDQSISAFGKNVLPNMASLNALIVWIPSNATDLSVQSLCGGLGKIIQNLEEFQLFMSNSKISEDGIQMIIRLLDLKSLTRLKVFDLAFNGISVSDLTRGQIKEIRKQLSIRTKKN